MVRRRYAALPRHGHPDSLAGKLGTQGRHFLPTPLKIGKFALPPFPESQPGRVDGAGTRYPLASEEQGVTNGLIDATVSGKPYPIKAWVVYGQNVLESIPRRENTLAAINQLEFLAVVDILPMEQVNYADLVLPEATYLDATMCRTLPRAQRDLHRSSAACRGFAV